MNFKNNIFKDKNIIVTGHTGFKGSWLVACLHLLGAKVTGISLKTGSSGQFRYFKKIKIYKDYRFDISDEKKLFKVFKKTKPYFVFHLAAQALVFDSIQDPIKTWKSNLIGTINILNCLNKLKHKCHGIIITSDKCYKNKEIRRGYKEFDELGGSDPYSASKASAEISFNSFYQSFLKNKKNIKVVSCRAGNVIGGGDWSRNRIIPDCIKSWSNRKTLIIRSPNATRPWQFVMEPIFGYLVLATHLVKDQKINGESFNFGPSSKKMVSVLNLIKMLSKNFKFSKFKVEKEKRVKESTLLKLNSIKIKKLLNWKTKLSLRETINYISIWYNMFEKNPRLIENETTRQIRLFFQKK